MFEVYHNTMNDNLWVLEDGEPVRFKSGTDKPEDFIERLGFNVITPFEKQDDVFLVAKLSLGNDASGSNAKVSEPSTTGFGSFFHRFLKA